MELSSISVETPLHDFDAIELIGQAAVAALAAVHA
jgi:hypothetical protein